MSGTPTPPTAKPDYGLDAPAVIRNLLLVAGAGLALSGSAALHWWSGSVPIPGTPVRIDLVGMGFGFFVLCSVNAVALLSYSKFGKVRARERLLDRLTWTGGEAVLDVGCGRGLMLIGAAKRLTTGTATGVDIWQAVDLTGNTAEATLENARRDGVASRVKVETADMRNLPFANATFDVVVSCAAIHNVAHRKDREQAIHEIARVLKPGGRALISDIRNLADYARAFARYGCPDNRRVGSWWAWIPATILTFGSLRPGTVIARKA